jgi:hypothetical protein
MSPTRKRFSAFEDTPESEQTEPAIQKITPSFTQPKKAEELPQVERIERLKPSQMMPDRFQPRRLLPASIRSHFYNGNLSCYQAAERWLALARQDNGYQGTIDRLLSMGSSFEEHGQIKPITGSWASGPGGRYVFMIETGERRFWAACLQHVIHDHKEESFLRVEVIKTPTRQRQVLENRHAEQPSAVSQACEVASLILAELGLQPDPNLVDEFEFFRQARLQRMPAGLWDKITPIMQLTRPRMVQLLNILQLNTSQLELADRYRLPERVIREVLGLPADQWERMLRLSIQESLTSDDIVEITEIRPQQQAAQKKPSKTAQNPSEIAWIGLRRFSSALLDLDEIVISQALDDVADSLITSGRAETTLRFLDELSMLIQARLSRRE